MRTGGLFLMHSLSSSSAASLNLKEGTNWWSDVDESPVWQDRIFHILAVLYAIVSVIAVVRFMNWTLVMMTRIKKKSIIWLIFFICIDSIGKDTIESTRIRMDDAESLSLSQFPRERRCVLLWERDFFFVFVCIFLLIVFVFFLCSSSFSVCLQAWCTEHTARGLVSSLTCCDSLRCWSYLAWCFLVDSTTYLAWHSESCFLHYVCASCPLLGGDLLPGRAWFWYVFFN